MNTPTPEQLTERPRIFRLPLLFRLAMAVVGGVTITPIGGLLLAWLLRDLGRVLVATVLLALAVAALYFWYYSRYSLMISPNGIEYRAPGHRLYAKWDEVEVKGDVWVDGWNWPVKGFQVRTNSKQLSSPAITFGFPSRDVKRAIPLTIFSPVNWDNGGVMAEIKKYRPDLVVALLDRVGRAG